MCWFSSDHVKHAKPKTSKDCTLPIHIQILDENKRAFVAIVDNKAGQ